MSSRTPLTFLQCCYFGSSLIRSSFTLLMCDVLLTVACPEYEVAWLWGREGENTLGLHVLPSFRAANPDAVQPCVPSLLQPAAEHPGFVQWCYSRGIAVVFWSMCGTAQCSWGFSRRLSGAAWPECALWTESAPGSLLPWDSNQDRSFRLPANMLAFGLRRVLPAGKSARVFSGEKITNRLAVFLKARGESLMLRKLQRSGFRLGAKLLSKPCSSGAKSHKPQWHARAAPGDRQSLALPDGSLLLPFGYLK